MVVAAWCVGVWFGRPRSRAYRVRRFGVVMRAAVRRGVETPHTYAHEKGAALTAPCVVVVVVRRRLPVETHNAVGKRYGVRVRQHETVGACAIRAACAFLA